ncbi:MAG: helix-turn-helix transcriptional regulator [Dehalococcoidia bacterium]
MAPQAWVTESSQHQPLDRILRPRELAAYVGLSLATLWRLRRAGSMPEPIRLSPGCVGWRSSVVDQWLASRDAVRR